MEEIGRIDIYVKRGRIVKTKVQSAVTHVVREYSIIAMIFYSSGETYIRIEDNELNNSLKMHQSILNHLFLPQYLPSSADDDYLIGENHQNEHEILEYLNEYLYSIRLTVTAKKLPIFNILVDCIDRWSRLQSPQNISIENIQSTIGQLPSSHFLPLYFHAQNAAILIEMDENNTNQPFISAWQVLLPTDVITSSLMPHFSCFPVTSYRLRNRSELTSTVHCELLMDLMINTIEYSKSYKSCNEVNETREVPQSHYVCRWWIEHFEGVQIDNDSIQSIAFKKKHRDQIRWNKAKLPFRRSGLWMTIKVVLHTIMLRRLKHLGIIVYKLFITHFLTYVMRKVPMRTELMVHCSRKIVRRLNKIECLLSSMNCNNKAANAWIHQTKQQIESQIQQSLPQLNWQNAIRISEKHPQDAIVTQFKFNNNRICTHSCLKLNSYLSSYTNSNERSMPFQLGNTLNDTSTVNQEDYIPLYDVLTTQMKCTTGIALTYMEVWIELCLEQWIDCTSSSINGKNRFEILFQFFDKYQNVALEYYYQENGATDPIGYSRFLLTSLTILHCMHKKLCQGKRFRRLELHSIDIPNIFKLFEFLVLPNRDDMIRAHHLYEYFQNFRRKQHPDLLNEIESKDAFGVYYAGRSTTMLVHIQTIRIQAEEDKQKKIVEVNNAKQQHAQLLTIVNNTLCDYRDHRHYKKCSRCKTLKKANEIKVNIFECPIPTNEESALAMIFELQMPIEIRSYRDILWQFINRLQTEPMKNLYEWLQVPPHDRKLKPYDNDSIRYKVKLVSSTKSISQTHYSSPPSVGSTSLADFLFKNSLKVEISPKKPITFDHECHVLTPQLAHHDYNQLQFTMTNTQFLQNHVIARLADCPPRLKSTHFIEFGSFRSGHRLQWWNLLIIFEMDSLPIAEESVAILIIHSLLQYGPVTSDLNTTSNSWCSESHRGLLEDHFVDELISRLNHRLDECQFNWQNEFVLVVISIIATRMLTICNSTKENELVDLVKKCRRIGENWMNLITNTLQTISPTAFEEVDKLRMKMIHIGIACVSTFSTHEDRMKFLLSSNEDMISLLKSAATIHDNIILNKTQSKISFFTRNMIRFSERVMIMVQPIVAKFLRKTCHQSLNDFVTIYWAVMKSKGQMKGHWKKRSNYAFDGWYDCRYQSRYISIDCIRGTFLVDGMTIGFLPEQILRHQLFVRTFREHIFEVQAAESSNTYITKHGYHQEGQIQYEFHFHDRTNTLTIKERHLDTNETF